MQQHLLTLALSHILLTPPFQPQVSCFVRARSDRDLERGGKKASLFLSGLKGLQKYHLELKSYVCVFLYF